MKFKQNNAESLEVNMTPLIDVVFLLLIFFMVTTTFQKDAELSINLPEASVSASENDKKTIEVSVNQSGKYFVNGKPIKNKKTDVLQSVLQDVSLGRKDTLLVIRGDAKANYQSIITVMDVASKIGMTHISLVTSEH